MKLTVVGLGKVGKTSIIKNVFTNISLEQLYNIPPTIFREESNLEPDWVEEPLYVVDLGGQEAYLSKHLTTKNFTQNDLVIFVIDLQDLERMDKTKEYFLNILNIINDISMNPLIGVMFHKYDPEERDNLTENISLYYNFVNEVFVANKFKPNIHFTSIKDNSCTIALYKLIIKISFGTLLRSGLTEVDPTTWHFSDLNKKEDIHQYLSSLGKNHGLTVRNKYLESIINNTPHEEMKSKFDYRMERDQDYVRLKVYLDAIPQTELISKHEVVDNFLQGFSKPIYCKFTKVSGEKIAEYYIQSH
ncbi:MAG: GTPase domain-containing protein [Candidatus Hodarchaeales archaeon]|jgi:GTPase SAR1 family protein